MTNLAKIYPWRKWVVLTPPTLVGQMPLQAKMKNLPVLAPPPPCGLSKAMDGTRYTHRQPAVWSLKMESDQ